MPAEIIAGVETSEEQIAELIESLAAPDRQVDLLALLCEDHRIYDQRSPAAVSRLRGWILLALGRQTLSDEALPFVLEELESGLDPYPVAAAARALRAHSERSGTFAPFLLQAFTNMAGRDEPLSFRAYGEYAVASGQTSPIREILLTFEWLGPSASSVLSDFEALCDQQGVVPRALRPDLERALTAIQAPADKGGACCRLPDGVHRLLSWRRGSDAEGSIDGTVFEDQTGARASFVDLFCGHPTIVVFFYTRCDNPLKCSLTVTKLGRVQELLRARGMDATIGTAAITYDPGFDSPVRIRSFGERRGVRFDSHHRMLRAVDGMVALRRHFRLGVNFIGSLVNRHRIEAYVLDAHGRVAYSFERLRWREEELVDRAMAVAVEKTNARPAPVAPRAPGRSAAALSLLPSFALAFLPKCPFCWATYLSGLGLAGLESVARLTWLQPLLIAGILVNVGSAAFRARTTGRMTGVWLTALGALAIIGSRFGVPVAALGVVLTLVGSMFSAVRSRSSRPDGEAGRMAGRTSSTGVHLLRQQPP